MSILPIEDEPKADTESRDQYGGPSTGSSSCGRSKRGRRQQIGGAFESVKRMPAYD